jgi:hypothetical protein
LEETRNGIEGDRQVLIPVFVASYDIRSAQKINARFRFELTRFRFFNFRVYQISVFGVYWANYRSSKRPWSCLMQCREAIARRGRQRRAYRIC